MSAWEKKMDPSYFTWVVQYEATIKEAKFSHVENLRRINKCQKYLHYFEYSFDWFITKTLKASHSLKLRLYKIFRIEITNLIFII